MEEVVDEAAVRGELAAISATFGKADVSRRLLTYLVECHLRGKVPRETDIALDVFHRDANFDGSQDAVVRVAVRTLRQRLDEYYHGAGRDRPLRLEVPRGGYRVRLMRATDAATSEAAPPAPRHPWLRPAAAVLAAALVASLLGNLWLWRRAEVQARPAPVPAHSSPVWHPLLSNSRPLTVVLGDTLLFPNPDAPPGRIQLLRDARINTPEQLRTFLGARADALSADPGTQLPTTLVPKAVAYGLVDVLPVVRTGDRLVEVRILDELPVDDLLKHDVLFMGPLVRIGPLAEVLFRESRYAFNYDEEPRRLLDRRTGLEYASSPGRRENASDYGLFASIRGPAGNRIMVLASVGGDLGLLPLVRRLTSASGLEELQGVLTQQGEQPMPDEFEALIAVSGYYRTDLSAELIAAHARPAGPAPDGASN